MLLNSFIKWVGGKYQLLSTILARIGSKKYDLYVEPFIGGGAVFFNALENDVAKRYLITDLNTKLINVYRHIQCNVARLVFEMGCMQMEYNDLPDMDSKAKYFYDVRAKFNTSEQDVKQAAMFIFLNKTCFNGLYRENSKGEYNVPFGKKDKIKLYDIDKLLYQHKLLNRLNRNGDHVVFIIDGSYDEIFKYIRSSNTFVYMDPPYRPVTEAGFNNYTKAGFNDKDQLELRNFCEKLNKMGIKFLLSNSDPKVYNPDDEFFDDAYNKFNIERIDARRSINSVGENRGPITELLISNY